MAGRSLRSSAQRSTADNNSMEEDNDSMEEDNESMEEAHARVVAEREARHAWEVERWKDAHGADIWHMEQRHDVAVRGLEEKLAGEVQDARSEVCL